VVVGDVGEADPDGFGDAVDLDEADAGLAVRDLIAACTEIAGSRSEDQADLFGFGEP
jgi:hypothetical protein